MRLNYSELILEDLPTLLSLEKSQSKGYLRDRVRFIRYLKSGEAVSQPKAGALIGLGARQSQNLWKKYKDLGIEAFLEPRQNHHLGKLSSTEIARLLARLDGDNVSSQKEIQSYLSAEMGIEYTQAGIHYLCKRLQVKLKTVRPNNARKDIVGEENFKKKVL